MTKNRNLRRKARTFSLLRVGTLNLGLERLLLAVFGTAIIVSVIVSQEQVWSVIAFSVAFILTLTFMARKKIYALGRNIKHYPLHWVIVLLSLTNVYLAAAWILQDLHVGLFLVASQVLVGFIVNYNWVHLKEKFFLWFSIYMAFVAITCFTAYRLAGLDWMMSATAGVISLVSLMVYLYKLYKVRRDKKRRSRKITRRNRYTVMNSLTSTPTTDEKRNSSTKARLIRTIFATVVLLATFPTCFIMWQIGALFPLAALFIKWFLTPEWKQRSLIWLAIVYGFILFLAYTFYFYGI